METNSNTTNIHQTEDETPKGDKKSTGDIDDVNTTQTPFPADPGNMSLDSLEPVNNDSLMSTPGIDMSIGPALTDATPSLCEHSETPEGKAQPVNFTTPAIDTITQIEPIIQEQQSNSQFETTDQSEPIEQTEIFKSEKFEFIEPQLSTQDIEVDKTNVPESQDLDPFKAPKEEQEEIDQTFATGLNDSELSVKDIDQQDQKQVLSSVPMEFTKNYSDDLLMGQSESAAVDAANADLDDYELPPHSGSSSHSDAKQTSPQRRKSSVSAQPSSSLAASPNLSAVKNLLLANYSKVSHILHWKNPIETGIIFGIGATLILALTFYSIISVFAYSGLAIILASTLLRTYKLIMHTLNMPAETRFDGIWEKALGTNLTMSSKKMHDLVDSSLSNINGSLNYIKQVLLVEDKFATITFGLVLYLLSYIGAWFNGMTLITIGYLALFSVPIFYEQNKSKIDHYVNTATSQISSAVNLVSNKVSSFSGSSSKKQN